MVDVLKWLLLMLLGLFIVWVLSGGPERAEKKNLTPIINGPSGIGGQINPPSVRPN